MSRCHPLLARRLTTTAAVVVLPLGALVGCGEVEQAQRATVEQEVQQARDHLMDSKSTSLRMSVTDPQRTIAKGLRKGPDPLPAGVVDTLLGGSVAITLDPAGDRTMRDVQAVDPSTPTGEALKLVNVGYRIDADGGPLAQVRLVDGTVYVTADAGRITGIAHKAGKSDVDAQLDELEQTAPPELRPLVSDLRAGEWVKIPLADYVDELAELGRRGTTPQPTPSVDGKKLSDDLLTAVKPFTEVTDAGGDAGKRVLNVKVQARQAIEAALDVLSRSGAVPGLEEMPPTVKEIPDGAVEGRVTLEDSHLTEVSLDLASVARLAPADEDTPDLTGTTVTLSVDDSADELTVPDNVSDVDVRPFLEQLLDRSRTTT